MKGAESWLIVIVAFITSLCGIFWPKTMWYLSEGWKFKNAEPSGCALVAMRIGGLFGVLVTSLILLSLWFPWRPNLADSSPPARPAVATPDPAHIPVPPVEGPSKP